MRPDRTERARLLCIRLGNDVSGFTTPAVRAWGPAWEIVHEPSVIFLDRLNEWEETGDTETAQRVKVAYRDVVKAWREAVRAFEMEGSATEVVR